MTEKRTNLSKLNNSSPAGGCQVCIGCGRCGKIHQDMHILVNFLPIAERTHSVLEDLSSDNRGYYVGVDVGTTTIAMCLRDWQGKELAGFSRVNPQRKWGLDVLSRIHAAEDAETLEQLRQCVWQVLETGLQELQKSMPDAEADVTIGLAGNTTMLYLLQGYVPEELGHAPFQVRHLEMVNTGLCSYPMYGFPPLSAFVGGDILAGIWSSGMWQSEELMLLIDLGTNGEMVLGNRHKILACATAAGPAFEGGPCQGIWGADMVSLTAELLERGLVDETGLLAEPYFEQGIQIGGVRLNQESIRALQLAKGAIRAGLELLLEAYGCTAAEVNRVLLAGGLGYYLQPVAAARIGLLPAVLAEKAVSCGNTALQGAIQAAADIAGRGVEAVSREWTDIQRKVCSINLAEQKEFQELYLKHLDFIV